MRNLIVLLLFLPLALAGQTATTFTGGTNWNPGTWSNGQANTTSFNPTIAANVTVNGNFTAGDLTLNGSRTLTVTSGNTLTLGASGLAKNFTSLGSTTINVQSGGTLIIWGDFISSVGSIQLNVQGTMTVHGNFTLKNGDNIDASPSGTITVSGLTTAPAGTQLQNGGTFHASGGCTPPSGGFCTSGSLPVELISFSAIAKEDNITLSWSTASELRFDYFNLEKSLDGESFFTIGKVKGHGTTNAMNGYSFKDTYPIIGYNYYRLTSVDFDGSQEVFGVISKQFDAKKQFNISPNPSDGCSILVNLNFEYDGDTMISIFNIKGVRLATYQMSSQEKEFAFLDKLASGIYYASLTSSGHFQTLRFVVR